MHWRWLQWMQRDCMSWSRMQLFRPFWMFCSCTSSESSRCGYIRSAYGCLGASCSYTFPSCSSRSGNGCQYFSPECCWRDRYKPSTTTKLTTRARIITTTDYTIGSCITNYCDTSCATTDSTTEYSTILDYEIKGRPQQQKQPQMPARLS